MESDGGARSAPWSWRLDPRAGSASLGPSSSATSISLNPLSSLSHASTSASPTDEIFWQDFRPAPQRTSRIEKKKARLHRFDSDDDEVEGDLTIRPKLERGESALAVAASPGVESDEEDAAGLRYTSSEASYGGQDSDAALQDPSDVKMEPPGQEAEENNSLTRKRQSKRRSEGLTDDASSSTHIIAQTIHKHALIDIEVDQEDTLTLDQTPPPPPLTYKETVRLVRLIAMLFRFPKSSRRIVRRRQRLDLENSATSSPAPECLPSSSTPLTPSSSTPPIELKAKYLAPPTSTIATSASHRPRILAHVHPEDARPGSDAVLKLIALIPAALPSRVGSADWIAHLAVKAKRDEYGNILLPGSAYAYASGRTGGRSDSMEMDGEGSVDAAVKVEGGGGGGKVTRSMRLRMGHEAPAIPLPQFWRRKQGVVKQGTPDTQVKTEGDETSILSISQTSTTDEPEVDALVPSASISSDTSLSPHPSSTPDPPPPPSQRRGRPAVNYSKLLAERMREKRQAKTLLLRTHQSLRKRRNSDRVGEGEDRVSTGGGVDEEGEGEEMDVETRANTLANSGKATMSDLTTVQRNDEEMVEKEASSTSPTQEKNLSVSVKQEDL
ncbi:hypothetical protein EX895_000558 [Sporisorium graminicola]|uniref:Uncharacterized protein n=1 Tax=Sporisorium graminicola TaxID=280036 RepID=A0A4U7L189_9BASI|nr:hypothetical protein EX895_000558 [Sporisorium graminicola]TKY90560.1 hypothetical protein EX895_000558 [Sporisorium graminicola]